jgi:hypothetical protein
MSMPVGGRAGSPGPGGAGLGQVANQAISEVLGWKPNADDPRGFVGALTQSFTLNDVEGHVEATWTPRTYAVQTDLGGGITGAQASLYTRAKNALDSALPLLDGLYPLDPEADPEYVKALREMARSQMTEIVKELGVVGLPSILRIDTYFNILLGQNPAKISLAAIAFDPDQIGGTLGELRDTYGIHFAGNEFNNSVADEQDITNFRVISDYMTSLMQSWMSNRNFFIVSPNQQAFFGTQLVLISRQFNVISETVDEVRFALDSVFIGPNERQTLLLEFTDPGLAPMFLEDALEEIKKLTVSEGPRLLRDGGKISVTNNILPVVESLQNLVEQAHTPSNLADLPDGFRTARVRNSLDDLQDQLEALVNLIEQVEQEVPPAEDKLTISGLGPISEDDSGTQTIPIFGNAFGPDATVTVFSTVASGIAATVTFFSAQRIDASISAAEWNTLSGSSHDIVVVSGGQTATLADAFSVDGNGNPSVSARAAGPANKAAGKAAKGRPNYQVNFGLKSAPPAAARPASDATTAAMKKQVAELQKSNSGLQESYKQLNKKVDAIVSEIGSIAAYIKGKPADEKK